MGSVEPHLRQSTPSSHTYKLTDQPWLMLSNRLLRRSLPSQLQQRILKRRLQWLQNLLLLREKQRLRQWRRGTRWWQVHQLLLLREKKLHLLRSRSPKQQNEEKYECFIVTAAN